MAAEESILKLSRYIIPLLNFGGAYVDDNGFICPTGDDSVAYTSEDKDTKLKKSLRMPRSYHEWGLFKKDPNTEIFNPFVNKKHMYFIGELIKQRLDVELASEDVDLFDEDVEIEIGDNVGIRQTEENGMVKIEFVAKEEDKTLAEGLWIEDKLAMWCACADAARSSMDAIKNLHEFKMEPYRSVPHINILIEKSISERKRELADERLDEGEHSEILDDSDERSAIRDFDWDDFVFQSDVDEHFAHGIDEDFDDENFVLPTFLDTKLDEMDLNTPGFNRPITKEENTFMDIILGIKSGYKELDELELKQ